MENQRNNILTAVVALIFAVLFIRLFTLQVLQGGKYHKQAVENAAKTVPIPAPRGNIYDRNGKIMVENRPVFCVQVLPQVLSDKNEENRKKILDKLGDLLGEKITYKITADRPIIVKDNIKPEIAMRIEERKIELEGVVVAPRPARYYPYGANASHVLGYIGEIEPAELARLKKEGYRMGYYIGKDGVEKVYDRLIRGLDGGKKVEVDVHGNPVRMLESLDPVPGADVVLTIDLDLQFAAEKALAGKAGAVIVLDPSNGEVLALASAPNYDPNHFIDPLNASKRTALSSGRHPFMNRALAIYPPASIFKVVTLTAALEEKVVKPLNSFYCPGYYKINRRIAKCWKESGHGSITAQEGLTQSCDIVFYELGKRLGADKIAKYARLYGLGQKTGIDIPQEKKGLVPDEAWKKERFGIGWYDGDSINYGIGQGFLQVTPLQMALIYGEIATGKRMKPFLVKEIRSRGGEVLFEGTSQEIARFPFSKETLAVLRRALFDVVDRATGRAAKVEGLMAAGKTGTAQNSGLPHAWFLCYAPYDNPKIVISSFVEHGEHGDQASAFVARDILTWYQKNRMEKASKEASYVDGWRVF